MSNSLKQLNQPINSLIKINRSALNNSTSKRLNSFAKANRFPATHLPPYFLQKSKTEPNFSSEKKMNKYPSIARADKTLYFKQQLQGKNNPSPLDYHVPHINQIQKILHKGDTIGKEVRNSLSRDKLPGPSNYILPGLKKKSFNKNFTFNRSIRNLSQFLNKTGRDSPGPKYQLSYTLSSFRAEPKKNAVKQKVRLQKISKDNNLIEQKVNRFKTKMLEKQLVAQQKKIVEISRKQKKVAKIKQANRSKNLFRQTSFSTPSKIPGPGNYVYFSQFSGWK